MERKSCLNSKVLDTKVKENICTGLVSVIIPIFNGEKYVKKCVRSILRQTYKNFELLLIDDGSLDNSYKICIQLVEMDDRIKAFHFDNGGVSCARNAGLKNAVGEYITFVDVDDELEENALEVAVKTISDTNADVVIYGWKRYFNNNIEKIRVSEIVERHDAKDHIIQKILSNYSDCGGGYPWNKLWRKSDSLNIELFRTDLSYFEDLEWVIRMLKKVERLVLCPECLYRYTVNVNGATLNPHRREKNELSYHTAIQYIIKDLEDLPEIQKWFERKYSPEVVNGIIHARRMNWITVEQYLCCRMHEFENVIMKSSTVSIKTKLRFCGLLLKEKIN